MCAFSFFQPGPSCIRGDPSGVFSFDARCSCRKGWPGEIIMREGSGTCCPNWLLFGICCEEALKKSEFIWFKLDPCTEKSGASIWGADARPKSKVSRPDLAAWKSWANSRASSVSALKYAPVAALYSSLMPDESLSLPSDEGAWAHGKNPLGKPPPPPPRYGFPVSRTLGAPPPPPSLDAAGDTLKGEFEMQADDDGWRDMDELNVAWGVWWWWWWRGDAVVEQFPSPRSLPSVTNPAKVQLKVLLLLLRLPPPPTPVCGGKVSLLLEGGPCCRRESCCWLLDDGCRIIPCHISPRVCVGSVLLLLPVVVVLWEWCPLNQSISMVGHTSSSHKSISRTTHTKTQNPQTNAKGSQGRVQRVQRQT